MCSWPLAAAGSERLYLPEIGGGSDCPLVWRNGVSVRIELIKKVLMMFSSLHCFVKYQALTINNAKKLTSIGLLDPKRGLTGERYGVFLEFLTKNA